MRVMATLALLCVIPAPRAQTPDSGTTYVHDNSGAMVLIDFESAPVLSTIQPGFARRGATVAVTVTGQQLGLGSFDAGAAGLHIDNVRPGATSASFDLTADADAALGVQTIIFTNAAGAASIGITVRPGLPVVSLDPLPLAFAPDGADHAANIVLSNADVIDHSLSLSLSDPTRASVTPTLITIPAGQTSAPISLSSSAASGATVTLNTRSDTLGAAALPVYVIAQFSGPGTSYAPLVGVVVGDGTQGGAGARNLPVFVVGNAVGLVLGPWLGAVAPRGMTVGATTTLTLSGQGLGSDMQVAIEPADGVSLGALNVAGDGRGATLSVTLSPAATVGMRRLSLRDVTGNVVPMTDPSTAQLWVAAGAPLVESVDPVAATRDSVVTLTIHGRNLQQGRVTIAPADGLTLDGTPAISADGTTITSHLRVAASGVASGAHAVIVTTAVGASSAVASGGNSVNIVSQIRGAVGPILSPAVGIVIGAAGSTAPRAVGPVVAPLTGVIVGSGAAALAPAAGVVGTVVNVVVQGVGLQGINAIGVLPATGVSSSTPVVSADGTSLAFTLTIGADAPYGPRRIVLQSGAGEVLFANDAVGRFLVTAPLPVLGAVVPDDIQVGAAPVQLVLSGANLRNVVGVRAEPAAGITIAGPFAPSADGASMTVTAQASAGASTGPRVLIVTTAAGDSSAVAVPGNTLNVVSQIGARVTPIIAPLVGVLVGANGATAAPLAVGPVLAPLVGVMVTPTVMPHSLAAANWALPVGVLLGQGASSATPQAWIKGTTGILTISGVGLDQVSGVSLSPADGVSLGAPTVSSDGRTLSVAVTVAATAPSGLRAVVLGSANGSLAFATPAASRLSIAAVPGVDSIAPILATQGHGYTLTVRGTGLRDVTAVVAEPAGGLAFDPAVRWSQDSLGERLDIAFAVEPGATIGARVIRLVVPGALTGADATANNTLTIVAPQ